MTEKLEQSIRDIRALAPKLNKATDEAHATVTAVESFLGDECSIGMPYHVRARTNVCEKGQEERVYLSYERVRGRYRVSVSTIVWSNPGKDTEKMVSENAVAWVSAPRAEKLLTFEYLPALLQGIAKRIQEAAAAAQETATTVTKVLNAIKAPTAKKPTPRRSTS